MKAKERDKSIKVLNDLLKINTDRVEGYEIAMQEAKDADLKIIFKNMAEESRSNIVELSRHVLKLDGEPSYGKSTFAGKIYTTWMELKTSLTGQDRKSLLNSCEFGEDAVVKAYRDALEETGLHEDLFDLVQHQAQMQRASHDVIKAYRDTSMRDKKSDYLDIHRKSL